MKRVIAMLVLLVGASGAFAQSTPQVAHWARIVGVITAQGVDNPVSNNIHSGTFAWVTRSGAASVNLVTGAAAFHVEGLVINGTMFSGTPGPIHSVIGTLVCNPGTNTESRHSTSAANLNAQGNAVLSGHISNIPTTCSNPLFLLRIANLTGANGRWIATGAERFLAF